MTFVESLHHVIVWLSGLFVLVWYVGCVWTMFFSCEKPSNFFSAAYPTSSLFLVVTFILLILGAAFGLSWATQ